MAVREDLAARFDRMVHSFEEGRGRILAANDAVAALQVTRRSEDGAIEVTVGADGAVVDLYIADTVLRRSDGRELARALLEHIADAQLERARSARAEYQRLTGLDVDPDSLGGTDAAEEFGRLTRGLFGA